jgi:lysyl-tRNA synthetase, class II
VSRADSEPNAPETRRYPHVNSPRLPRWIGLATYLVGLIDIASGLTHGLKQHLDLYNDIVPGALSDAAAAATVVSGILLLLLAHALRRRKRRAWRAVLALLAVSVVFHIVKGEPVPAALSVGLIGLLWVNRAEFNTVGDPRSRWLAVRAFGLLAVISMVLGVAVVEIRRGDLVGSPSFWAILKYTFLGLFGFQGPVEFRVDRDNDIVGALLLGLGLMTALTTIYLALRPPEPRPHVTPEDEARMRELLRRHGTRDSLGYFALRRDKSVLWSDSGKSCIAYRVVSGVMLASGDPLGDPDAWPGAISRFVCEAERHAWTPAVMGCSRLAGEVWCREMSYDAIELGDEAVVEVADFTLDGRAMRNVRQMVKRVQRAGYSTEVSRVRDLDPAELAATIRQARRWRGTDTERGFSMALGRLGDPLDGGCVLVSAHKDGVLRGFLHFVPWGEDGISLDLMRRDRSADPGLNELLIAAVLHAAPDLGVQQVSLNFAVFRAALERGERLGAGPVSRAWRALLVFASRWFQIESLYRFNAKFAPAWVPRYLVYPAVGDLPRIGFAALEAEAFIVWPELRPRGWWRVRRARVGGRRPEDTLADA